MHSVENVLFVTLLAAVFVAKMAHGIKCYQCDDCPDSEKLPGITECRKVNWIEAFISQTEKIAGKTIPPGPVRSDLIMTASKHGLGSDARPTTCFKQHIAFNNKALVYRGCGPQKNLTCKELAFEDKTMLCFCDTDGCNRAPNDFIPASLIAICLFIVLFNYV